MYNVYSINISFGKLGKRLGQITICYASLYIPFFFILLGPTQFLLGVGVSVSLALFRFPSLDMASESYENMKVH